jgi:hypothetical protein
MKRKWTDDSFTAYCRFVLRNTKELSRLVRAFYIPMDQLGHEALTHSRLPIVFYSNEFLPRAVVWHECGHLMEHASNTKKPIENPTESFVGQTWSSIKTIDRERVLKDIGFEESVECERFAQCWALNESVLRDYKDVNSELIAMMGAGWDNNEVYAEAKRRVMTGLKSCHYPGRCCRNVRTYYRPLAVA